jgi:exopolyphosphatase / guanosine-5'-triphosphate,3'-diphosphate pyrophosphatase
VAQFTRRYHVEAAHAERVRALALGLYDALGPAPAGEEDAERLLLDWAARLAEIGLSIAHAEYHKHSAYVIANADMPGFSRMEQQRLARLVLAHRGKLSKIEDLAFDATDWKLVFALRLAALLLRSRTDARPPVVKVSADTAGFSVAFPQRWLEENPLSANALEAEAACWKAIGMKLAVRGVPDRKVQAA